MQKKQQIKMILLVDLRLGRQKIERIISNKDRLTAWRIADDDMIWVTQKEQQLKG